MWDFCTQDLDTLQCLLSKCSARSGKKGSALDTAVSRDVKLKSSGSLVTFA